METRVAEIADGVHQLTTYIADADFSFNQYLLAGEEPLLFHTGPRQLFPLVSDAVARVIPAEGLRWIGVGHVESDECGAMNEWLGVAPGSTVVQGMTGCLVSLTDLADRPSPPRTCSRRRRSTRPAAPPCAGWPSWTSAPWRLCTARRSPATAARRCSISPTTTTAASPPPVDESNRSTRGG